MKQKTRKIGSRWIGLILALCILIAMMPAGALAADPVAVQSIVFSDGQEHENINLGDVEVPEESTVEYDAAIYVSLDLDEGLKTPTSAEVTA